MVDAASLPLYEEAGSLFYFKIFTATALAAPSDNLLKILKRPKQECKGSFMKKNAMIPTNKSDVMELLQSSTKKTGEFILGIMKSEKADWIDSAGRIFSAVLKNKKLQQLGQEIEFYREKGQIKDDFLSSDYAQMSLKEIFNIIDNDPPDETKFNAIKSIFLTGVSEKSSKDDEILAYQLLQLVSKLTSGELLTLKAIRDIETLKTRSDKRIDPDPRSMHNWRNAVAQQAGFSHMGLTQIYETNLVSLNLIDQNDPHGQIVQNYRMTSLGKVLCDFIEKYTAL